MTLTVRLPLRVEQQLAEYCVKRKLTKSEAVKQALDGLLRASAEASRHPFIGGDQGDGSDVSGNIKAALRARFNPPGGAAVARKRAR
jgi:hypothetical protein